MPKTRSKMIRESAEELIHSKRGSAVTLPPSEAEIASIIEAGGGKYVGILMAIPKKMESVILFISPQSGTTLGIPISRLTVEAVSKQLAHSDAAFAKYPSKETNR